MTPLVSLQDVVSEMDLQNDFTHAYLNKVTGKLVMVTDEEIAMAEEDIDAQDILEWQQEIVPITKEILESDDYTPLPSQFEIHEYRIMENFCDSITDTRLQEELLDSIRGSGAFRRFKSAVRRHGIENRWFQYREKAFEEIAVQWLEDNGIPYTR